MRIVHVGGMSSPDNVDGINTVIWTVAIEQARLGHRAGLLVGDPPDADSIRFANEAGVTLHYVPASRWRYDDGSLRRELLLEPAADIVHFHSVFQPRQATLARSLRRWGIPYVVTPHGGLMPQVLDRGRYKKQIYSKLVEQPRIRQAAAIAYITPNGEADIRRYVPEFTGPIRWVPNPVDVDRLQEQGWRPESERPLLTFLGRYDVYHKGLDRLAEIARRVPQADFRLYGVEDPRTGPHLNAIRRYGPPNLQINDPVFGAEKLAVLGRTTMYIQVSRWEALSISILEALALGAPSAISDSMSMASMFTDNDLGLVLSTSPELAAHQLRQALSRPQRLQAWSDRSQLYAKRNFAPESVARRVIEVYDEALERHVHGGLRRFPTPNGRHDAPAPDARTIQVIGGSARTGD